MTVHSMTSYGYGECFSDNRGYTCEVRTLNSRYLEVSVRLPRSLIALEAEVTAKVKGALRRGKVEVNIDHAKVVGQSSQQPELSPETVRHYLRLSRELAVLAESEGLPAPAPLSVAELLRFDGVLGGEGNKRGPQAADEARGVVLTALQQALHKAVGVRAAEGEVLSRALRELLQELERERQAIQGLRTQILPNLRQVVLKRLANLKEVAAQTGERGDLGLSEERLATEVLLLSDKMDIDEELTRLGAHGEAFTKALLDPEGAGRKLDFLCQEMHREANTMSNKLVQIEVASHTLALKQIIERLRQQVQNIE